MFFKEFRQRREEKRLEEERKAKKLAMRLSIVAAFLTMISFWGSLWDPADIEIIFRLLVAPMELFVVITGFFALANLSGKPMEKYFDLVKRSKWGLRIVELSTIAAGLVLLYRLGVMPESMELMDWIHLLILTMDAVLVFLIAMIGDVITASILVFMIRMLLNPPDD